MAQLGPQLLGVVLVGGVVFALSLVLWLLTKVLSNGIRVTEEEEIEGLDFGEHGNTAYPEFGGGGGVFAGSVVPSSHRAAAPVPGIAGPSPAR
jgi:Amt family ammonium transporter